MNSSSKWTWPAAKTWLTQTPLTASWRRRLELAAGVVASGAAVVALAGPIQPSPAKIAELHHRQPFASSPAPPVEAAAEPVSLAPDFYPAVEAGDVKTMDRLYKRGMPLHGLLHVAARAGKREAVAWLLDHDVSPYEREWSGDHALLAADPYPDVTSLLLARGAKEPSLELAARSNAVNAVTRILAKGAVDDLRSQGHIEYAASATSGTAESKRKIIDRLLDAGFDPNGTYGDGALSAAVEACDRRMSTASIVGDCVNIIDLLLSRGTKLTGRALGSVLALEGEEIREALLDKFLALPITKDMTSNALATASDAKPKDVKRLVAKGVDWAWRDGEQDSAVPLLAAARRMNRDQVETFIEAGAPVDVHYKDGSSALTEAIDNSSNNPDAARIVEVLVQHGANVNRRLPDGRTPLFAAAEGGEIRTVNFLLAKGARVNEMVLDDNALDVAESHGNTAAARILHAHGGRRSHHLGGTF